MDRRRTGSVVILLIGILPITTACRSTTAVPLTGVRGSPTPGIAAHNVARRGDSAITTTVAAAYPHPATAGPAAAAGPTAYDERKAVEALFPSGAVADVSRHISWYGRNENGSTLYAYGVPYTADGRPSIAAITQSEPPRLLWDLVDHPDLAAGATLARPLRMEGAGAGLLLADDGGARLLILAIGDVTRVAEDLALPASLVIDGLDEATVLLDQDLTGDGQPDPVLESGGILALYERQVDGSVRLVTSAGPGALLMDQDRDGLAELIAPEGPGAWSRSVWREEGFQQVETLRDPDLPAPQSVTDRTLPPLPATLTYVLHSERAIMRWPREGGVRRELWRDEAGDAAMRGLRVSRDSGKALVAIAPGNRPTDARLILLAEGAAARDLPTHGELRDFQISADGQRAIYIGLGVDAAGAELEAIDGTKAKDRGTVFVVDSRQPDQARGIAACEAVIAPAGWVVGCRDGLALSPSGQEVAFGDGKGLWTVGLDGGSPRTVVEQTFVPTDGPGSRIYAPQSWSPDERRILAQVGGYEGSTPAVIELPDGKPREIPDTSNYSQSPYSEQVWLPDGDALLVTQGTPFRQALAEVRVVDAADPAINTAVLGSLPISEDHRYQTYGAAVAPDGSLRFGTRHPDGAFWQGNAVFRAQRDGSGLRRLATLPSLTDDHDLAKREMLLWSPDGDTFVVRFAQGRKLRTLVGLADGTALWDASVVLNDADWITWSR